LAVDESHWRALEAGIKQFFQRRLVGTNILFDEYDALLR
jgi:hypothetical protein